MKKVLMYTSPTCGYCKVAKQYFNQNNIACEEKDVTDPKVAEEAVNVSGQMGVPIIVIGEGNNKKVLSGFNKDELDVALKLK
ncbi:MAG: hypothetical protein ACD_63C00070G0009 [uncultured bacterium]|nr:MAG: hypothetical protein ACD_63C00070G0009 [uncultured bacterium]